MMTRVKNFYLHICPPSSQERDGNLIHRFVGIVAQWLERRDCDRHGLGSKPTRAILLCPWERHFTAISPAWRSWQAVLNFSRISIKLKNLKISTRQQYIGTPEAGQIICLTVALCIVPPSLCCKSAG